MTGIVIAVDGPSASGKGTLARRLAGQFGLAYLDTGSLYRAVGLAVLQDGGSPTNPTDALKAAQNLDATALERLSADPALRTETTALAASQVAALPEIRASLLKFQQDFCKSPPQGAKGAVLDGRDIGTVIAPEAVVKIYVTASVEVRAQRRFKELRGRGENATENAILEDLAARDERDANRASSPAKAAPDAVVIDTTHMTADAAFEAALKVAQDKLGL